MRYFWGTCVVGLLAVGSANGQIRIFFDTAGVGENEDRGNVDPLSYGNPAVDGSAGPVRLYIYGEFLSANALWIAINFDITVDGSAELTDIARYNHVTQVGPRWTGPVNGGTINNPQNASFRAAAIVNPQVSAGGMWNWDEAYAKAQTGYAFNAADIADDKHYRREWDSQNGELGTTLLGYVDVEGDDGSLWLTVEDGGFSGGSSVYFGYGDDPVAGGEIGIRTTIADATVVPEPASLMLLGLGVLAMRGRRRNGLRRT